MIRADFRVMHGMPALSAMVAVDEMYLPGSVGGRSVFAYGCGMMVGKGLPQSSIRCANPREMGMWFCRL